GFWRGGSAVADLNTRAGAQDVGQRETGAECAKSADAEEVAAIQAVAEATLFAPEREHCKPPKAGRCERASPAVAVRAHGLWPVQRIVLAIGARSNQKKGKVGATRRERRGHCDRGSIALRPPSGALQPIPLRNLN